MATFTPFTTRKTIVIAESVASGANTTSILYTGTKPFFVSFISDNGSSGIGRTCVVIAVPPAGIFSSIEPYLGDPLGNVSIEGRDITGDIPRNGVRDFALTPVNGSLEMSGTLFPAGTIIYYSRNGHTNNFQSFTLEIIESS